MALTNTGDSQLLPLVEEFLTIQGEGYHSGKAAYFIRLGGCDVGCSWCDSKYSWNPDIHPPVSTEIIVSKAIASGIRSVVITGGEPLMWNLDILCEKLHSEGFTIYLETSGTCSLSGKYDWVCLSPKKNMPPLGDYFSLADELKVIIESADDFAWAEENSKMVRKSCKLFLQPEWSKREQVMPLIVDYVLKNPKWIVSLQIHKYMHIP